MRSFLRVLSIILLVAWMGVIFFFSHQTAQDSSEISGGVIEMVAEKLYPDFENLSESEKAEVVSSFQFVVRKGAHIFSFAVLGFFAFLTFISYTRLRYWLRIMLAALVSLLYAAGDEVHQRFIAGRSCELRDFLIDAVGIVLSLVFWFGLVKLVGPLRRKTAFVSKKPALALPIGMMPVIESPNLEIKASTCEEVDISEDSSEDQPQQSNEAVFIEEIPDTPEQTECEAVEEKMEETPVIKPENPHKDEKIEVGDDMQYAASAIGKVVVEVSKVCNKLGDSNDPNKKELINLALGRSEVFKSQVLYIVQSEADLELKKKMIEQEKNDAFDYFDSIIAQMC